jgi:hypothetical protein
MSVAVKFLGAVAVAGIVAAGGSAFTASGLTSTVDSATQMVGGTVNQNVYGATLSGIEYGVTAEGSGRINQVTLSFSGTGTELNALEALQADAITVGVTGGQWSGADREFVCDDVDNTTDEAVCTIHDTQSPFEADTSAYVTGPSGMTVQVLGNEVETA